MSGVVVLGGYGYSGLLCVREIAETTQAPVVVAGRSIQRATRVALACGERASAAYADAADRRTLFPLIPGSAAVVACCGGDWTAALEVALEARVPFVGVGALRFDDHTMRLIADRAWEAQIPVILQAGAVPGLPGVLAEWAVRHYSRTHSLRIASTGPWEGTETARRDLAALRSDTTPVAEYADGADEVARGRPVRWPFADPIGPRTVRPARALDLLRFARGHCIDNLLYLEPDPGFFARGFGRVFGLAQLPGFALEAEIQPESDTGAITRIGVEAEDAATASTAVVGVLVRAVLQGRMQAGIFAPHDAINPMVLLDAIEKRGVRVRLGP